MYIVFIQDNHSLIGIIYKKKKEQDGAEKVV